MGWVDAPTGLYNHKTLICNSTSHLPCVWGGRNASARKVCLITFKLLGNPTDTLTHSE